MSKYIYATVYEQFTGLKPPEPKSHKPRRRRGYGHPYRMRLNMQETEDQDQDQDLPSSENDHFNNDELVFQSEPTRQPLTQNHRHQHYAVRTTPQNPIESPSVVEEQKASCSPKVTYKKRRHYEPAAATKA